MVITSLAFVVFFVAFFAVYWSPFTRSDRLQNLSIFVGSYLFYAYWDWRFLSLLLGTSLLTFWLGGRIAKAQTAAAKRTYLAIGLGQGVGALLLFKYYDFFGATLVDALARFGFTLSFHSLQLILPLGISFFTFRTMGYLLDVAKGKCGVERDWVAFCAFVAFFPTLPSGPIDKAGALLPQLHKPRVFDRALANDGLRQAVWGLFKKAVIADNCTAVAEQMYANYHSLPGSTLLIGAFINAIALYADFSGYSDMAIGVSKLVGLEVAKNFAYPFFSPNIAEYWRKWHMSLTIWFTEHVFTPLTIAFRDWGKLGLMLAVFVNFMLIGIWHGANWTYILFGAMHVCAFLPLVLRGTVNKRKKRNASQQTTLRDAASMLLNFGFVMLTFIVFQAPNVTVAAGYIRRMLSWSLFQAPVLDDRVTILGTALLSVALLAFEWKHRDREYAVADLGRAWPKPVRWAFYYGVAAVIFFLARPGRPFIYFQF